MNRILEVRVPYSAGEFLQGRYLGKEALISCPIDIYSLLILKKGKRKKLLDKSDMAIERFIEIYKIKSEEIENLEFEIIPSLPYAKGYATSTAEISSIYIALATYFDIKFTELDIAKFCSMIEPTDSIFFSKYIVFDHINGEILKEINGFEKFIRKKILIIEFDYFVDTVEFRNKNTYDSKDDLTSYFLMFEKGLKSSNRELIYNAITNSSLINQKIINKEYLKGIIELADNFNTYGVNIAHSGSLIGVIFDSENGLNKFKNILLYKNILGENIKIRTANIISGGYEVRWLNGINRKMQNL